MSSETPAWLIALTILAPIFASFGVLWLTNKQQSRNLRAQHELALEKDKIAATVLKAEELYSDIQRRKKHIEIGGFQYITYFQMCASKNEFLEKTTQESPPIDFDLVRLELNLRAYFPELEDRFRHAERLVHAAGKIQADMIMRFDAPKDAKRDLAGEYIKAQQLAVRSLEEFSQALAAHISAVMQLKTG
jgi:hypothetical protein